MRTAEIIRKTNETDIYIKLNLDGNGETDIDTGIGFLDHMLSLMAFHGSFDMTIKCRGDINVDDHHTIEDIGIALGQAFSSAIGDKRGIRRYSSIYIPMDESLCRVALDISNRPYLVYDVDFAGQTIGAMSSHGGGVMSTQNFKEFFRAFVYETRLTLHINVLYGENDHHKIEAVFKGAARALKEGIQIISETVSSSKGVL